MSMNPVLDIARQAGEWGGSVTLSESVPTVDLLNLDWTILDSVNHRFVFGLNCLLVPGSALTKSVVLTLAVAQYCPIGIVEVDIFITPKTFTCNEGVYRSINCNNALLSWLADAKGIASAAPPVIRLSATFAAGRGDLLNISYKVAQAPASYRYTPAF